MTSAPNMDFDYDRVADVLYISMRRVVPCLCVADEEFETINYRYSLDTHDLVGVTIWAYSHWDRTRLRQILSRTFHDGMTWSLPG